MRNNKKIGNKIHCLPFSRCNGMKQKSTSELFYFSMYTQAVTVFLARCNFQWELQLYASNNVTKVERGKEKENTTKQCA